MTRTRHRLAQANAGFTVLELLVAVAVVALLVALLLPAISAARETARSTACRSRLRQLALASANYADSHGVFAGSWEPHGSLLPYLEIDRGAVDARLKTIADADPLGISSAVLTCPSDEWITPGFGHVNFDFSHGAGDSGAGRGIIRDQDICRPRDVSDGLSNTVLAMEFLIGPRAFPQDRWRPPRKPLLRRAGEPQDLRYRYAVDCSGGNEEMLCLQADGAAHASNRGLHSFGLRGPRYTRLTHVMPPNAPLCECAGVPSLFGFSNGPSSRHRGIVNVTTADGAARMVSEAVDRDVWRAAGTIAGGEAGAAAF